MAGIKGLGAAAPVTKEAFVGSKSARVLPAPRQKRVMKGDDPTSYAANIMLYGPISSGKTLAAADLLEMGYKVFFVITDIGSNGIIAIKLELKKRGLKHLLSNLRAVTLEGFKEINDFLEEPAAFDPDFYKFAPDFLYWDGFAWAQQMDMMEKAGEMIVEQNDINEGRKEVSELREQGYKFELADYQVLRNVTVRILSRFCKIHNKETGQLIHKIVTCQESLKSKGADKGGGFTESSQPLMTGAGGVLAGGAFDLIIRTTREPFMYVIAGQKDSATKNRGFSLPNTMEASFKKVWETVADDLDIKKGAVDETQVKPVLLAEEEENV